MPWTKFWDMHSGGSLKEDPHQYIYIEASEEEAKLIFYNKFGHNPERVTCTCCGDDYTIEECKDLFQATGFHRNAGYASKKGCKSKYVSPCTALEDGWKVDKGIRGLSKQEYQTMEQFEARDDVLIIRAKDIDPLWRGGRVPQQGYVWVD